MSEVTAPAARAPREPRNGVNTPALMATINAVKSRRSPEFSTP